MHSFGTVSGVYLHNHGEDGAAYSDQIGGIAGVNRGEATISNVYNAGRVSGRDDVGGIAGSNAGEITVSALDENGQPAGNENAYLVNRGTITGQQYVGGVAGVNTGTIANTNNSVTLHVKDQTAEGADVVPQYFGGVVGLNDEAGTITNATNYADVNAEGAIYVGGIAGKNEGILENLAGNYGDVTGKDHVGGVAGENTQELKDITVTNQGSVTASGGGAGGIFGVNEGGISHAHLTNEGNVTGTTTDTEEDKTGTGGIFGINHAKITDSILENLTGNVTINMEYGQIAQNVGGLIGINTGNVSTSSLKNEADINVKAEEGQTVENIGGLIGQNTGDIIGGRTDKTEDGQNVDNGYYKYQIYNNGTITVTGNGSNIGGLIGINQKREDGTGGNITAGYNTGAIIAENSTNVGGIAGTNENGAEISNAYNTTTVTGTVGTNDTGSIAGTNNGTISNVYGISNLVGNASDSISNGYDISDAADNTDWKDSGSYGGFVFKGDDAVWKIYEGSTNPLLKVFLTKVTISEGTDLGLVYNGQDQDINLGDFISHTGISAADNFEAYQNNNSLIQNTSGEEFEHKNAGTYSNWLYSGQIAASSGEDGFNPNNLGYDIDFTQDIDQAKITISLDEIHRTYGNSQIHDGKDYGYSITGQNIALTDAMRAELEAGMTMDEESIKDGAVDSLADGKTYTNNAGDYTWLGNFSLGTDTGADSLANNYTFVKADGQFVDTITVSDGKSVVEKAQLTVNLNTIDRIYGDTTLKNDSSYGISGVTGLVNGDEDETLSLSGDVVIEDGALIDNGTRTNDVKKGGYTWNVGGESIAGNFDGIENLGTNYEITVNDGKSNVEQREITINDLNASIVYGNQDGNGLVIKDDLGLNGVVYGDDVSLSGNAVYTTGGSYDKNRDDRVTADAGKYEDSLFVRGLTLSGDKEGNYKLTMDEAVGDVEVTKAQLTVNVGKAETTYGTVFDSTKYEYTLEGIVNGDSMDAVKDQIGNVSYTNTAAGDGTDGKWTADAGTYEGGVGIAEESLGELTNYDITTVTKGMAVVNKAQISITVDDKEIYAGEALPEFTGTDIQEQLVNGDRIDTSYWYAPGSEVDTSVADSHGIGIHFGNAYYGESTQNANWPDVWTGFGNYTVTFTPGTLTVMDWPAGVEEPPVDEHWNFLFDDNPWDRNRDFRERKANIHFIAGGMTL